MGITMSLTPMSTANNCVAPFSSCRLRFPLASVSTPLLATTGFVSAFALPYIYMCLHLVFLSYVLEVLCIKVSRLSCNSDAAISRDPHIWTPVLFPPGAPPHSHLPPPFFSFLSVVSHTVQAMVRRFSLLRELSNLLVYTLDMAEFTLFGK